MCVVENINSISLIIWPPIIASASTLIGVWLVIKNNKKIHETQLKHEADEKAKDRLAALRKDVYLVAAEELTKANNMLGQLPLLNFKSGNLPGCIQDMHVSSAKLQLIASQKTALYIGEYQATFTEVFFKLMAKASLIHEINDKIELRNKRFDDIQVELSRIRSNISENIESGHIDQLRHQILIDSYAGQQKLAKETSDDRSRLYKEKNDLHLQYANEMPIAMQPIQNISSLLLIEIREEIGIESDKDEFAKQAKLNNERIKVAMETLFKTIVKPDPSSNENKSSE